MNDETRQALCEKIEAQAKEIAELKEGNNYLRDENDKMRNCLKYLDKHGGLGIDIHDRITKALTRTN